MSHDKSVLWQLLEKTLRFCAINEEVQSLDNGDQGEYGEETLHLDDIASEDKLTLGDVLKKRGELAVMEPESEFASDFPSICPVALRDLRIWPTFGIGHVQNSSQGLITC